MRKPLMLLVALACAVPLACGEENAEELSAENERISDGLGRELDSLSSENKDQAWAYTTVDCTRAKPKLFDCRVYRDLRPNLAEFAAYRVRDCVADLVARRASGSKEFPAKVVVSIERDASSAGCGAD